MLLNRFILTTIDIFWSINHFLFVDAFSKGKYDSVDKKPIL